MPNQKSVIARFLRLLACPAKAYLERRRTIYGKDINALAFARFQPSRAPIIDLISQWCAARVFYMGASNGSDPGKEIGFMRGEIGLGLWH